MQITSAQFERARANLTRFVINKAANLARELGFSYEDRADAPGSDEAVAAAFERSVRTHAAFPVWNGAPVIRDTKTGRWFAFSWAGLIDHARAAGISDDEPVQQAENPAV